MCTDNGKKSLNYIFARYAVVLVVLGIQFSCKTENATLPGIDFGNGIMYDDFLWFDEHRDTLKVRLIADFNDWASELEEDVRLQFKITNDENNQAWDQDFSFLINDRHLMSSEFILPNSQDSILNIELVYIGEIKEDIFKSGHLVVNANLDRVNEIGVMGETPVFRWTMEYKHSMHPVKKGILVFLSVMLTLLLIWFILKPSIFPSFKSGKIQIVEPYYATINIKNYRRIIFTDKSQKESLIRKLFIGKINYHVHQDWHELEIMFIPAGKNKARIVLPVELSIEPYVSKITRGNTYNINSKKHSIIISYL